MGDPVGFGGLKLPKMEKESEPGQELSYGHLKSSAARKLGCFRP